MKQTRTLPLSRKLLRSVCAVFIWMALVTGVFGLLTGSYFSGAAWTGLAVLLLAAVLEGSLFSRLENKQVPLASFLLVALVIFLIGASEIINMLTTRPALTVSYVFDALYSLGFIVLGGYAASQLLRQDR